MDHDHDTPTPLTILSDIPRLPDRSGGREVRSDLLAPEPAGLARKFAAALRLYLRSFRYDAVVLNQPAGLLTILCALRTVLPRGKARLVVFDVILPRPADTTKGRLKAWLIRALLPQVDLFLLHVKDPGGLTTHYGISRETSRFVPFKVNRIEKLGALATPDRGYILAPGRSHRDYATFLSAMAALPYPALILMPASGRELAQHGTSFQGREVPPNVKIVHDDGTKDSWDNHLAGARLVVLPIRPDTLSAAGNSTYLLAMSMGKCVVTTDSPGARGIIEDGTHALIVPPGDPDALREAVRRAWEDDDLRQRLARAGHAYALSLGGEERLHRDIVDEVVSLLERNSRLAPLPGVTMKV
jgi:glycosyltransferase involved in cell wall biosynthesis